VRLLCYSLFSKIFSCESCSRSIKTEGNLNQHVRSVHGPKRFTCSYCERSFTRKSSAQKRERLIHQNICESVCSKRNVNRGVISDVAPAKRARTTELPSPPPVPTEPQQRIHNLNSQPPYLVYSLTRIRLQQVTNRSKCHLSSLPRRQFQSTLLHLTRNFNFDPTALRCA